MKHLINWLEIPVIDIERAKAFYGAILGIEFYDMSLGDVKYALFPSDDQFNNGALAQGEYYKPILKTLSQSSRSKLQTLIVSTAVNKGFTLLTCSGFSTFVTKTSTSMHLF